MTCIITYNYVTCKHVEHAWHICSLTYCGSISCIHCVHTIVYSAKLASTGLRFCAIRCGWYYVQSTISAAVIPVLRTVIAVMKKAFAWLCLIFCNGVVWFWLRESAALLCSNFTTSLRVYPYILYYNCKQYPVRKLRSQMKRFGEELFKIHI